MNSDATTTPQQGERGRDLWLELEQEEGMMMRSLEDPFSF